MKTALVCCMQAVFSMSVLGIFTHTLQVFQSVLLLHQPCLDFVAIWSLIC